jgi:16S rRNA (uracil1498-N3)-methyltransferase
MGGIAPGILVKPPRFYLPQAAPGGVVSLPLSTAHHARDVLRLRGDDPLRVFDGQGHEFEARVERITRRETWIRVLEPVSSAGESPLAIVLAMSLLKNDPSSLAIQKCTELGVMAIWPFITDRTDTEGRNAWRGSRLERWRKIAAGAAEQCGRSVVPVVDAPCTLSELLTRRFEGVRLVCVENGGRPLDEIGVSSPSSALVCVGPAGGWTPEEASQLSTAGFLPLTLGPRILRAETAAIVAVADCQTAWGDMRTPRRTV